MKQPNGYIVWEGVSRFDNAPLVIIAVGFRDASSNSKTGGMIQTYILRQDIEPTAAIKSGADGSICGIGEYACIHRGDGTGRGRTCYVNVGQGVLSVYRTYIRGGYPMLPNHEIFAGRKVRFGTYGDPAAAPGYVWAGIAGFAAGWTGYTHQWRTRPDLKAFCMASADTLDEAIEAQTRGWRTFRVALPNVAGRLDAELTCPASAEAGKKLQCAQCMACGGGNRRGSIVINAHGGFAVMANIKKRAAA